MIQGEPGASATVDNGDNGHDIQSGLGRAISDTAGDAARGVSDGTGVPDGVDHGDGHDDAFTEKASAA